MEWKNVFTDPPRKNSWVLLYKICSDDITTIPFVAKYEDKHYSKDGFYYALKEFPYYVQINLHI